MYKTFLITVLLFTGIALLIASFIVPPMGIISPSVISSSGMVFTMSAVIMAIQQHYSLRLSFGKFAFDWSPYNKDKDEKKRLDAE